jgi:hypothetical protein
MKKGEKREIKGKKRNKEEKEKKEVEKNEGAYVKHRNNGGLRCVSEIEEGLDILRAAIRWRSVPGNATTKRLTKNNKNMRKITPVFFLFIKKINQWGNIKLRK